MKRFAFAAVAFSAALTAAAFAAPASVRVEGAVPQSSGTYKIVATTVEYDDADLTTGAAALLGRIEKAAENVCTSRANVGSSLTSRIERCKKDAVRNAVASVQAPALVQAASSR